MIPDEAVEAALSQYYERGGLTFASAHPDTRTEELADMRIALEAAAPHLMRAAWDEGNDAHESSPLNRNPYAVMGK